MNAPGGARGVSSVQENPTGAADLSQIRWSRTVQTLGRRPETTHFTGGRRGRKRARGIVATPVAAAVREDVLRRGTPRGRGMGGVTTPRPGRRASSDPASRCLSPCVSERRERKPCGKGSRAVRRRTAARRSKRSRNGDGTPWTAAALEAARRGGERNRRGGEKPRGRNVPGRQPPGGTDPLADVVEGGLNPRRGRSRP
jgi:hypothetical protein